MNKCNTQAVTIVLGSMLALSIYFAATKRNSLVEICHDFQELDVVQYIDVKDTISAHNSANIHRICGSEAN